MRAMKIAATGMDAQQTRVEVISNNIANMSTVGYQARRAEFADLHYQQIAAAGSISLDNGHLAADRRAARPRRAHRRGSYPNRTGLAMISDRRRRSTSPSSGQAAGSRCTLPERRRPPTPATARSAETPDGLLVNSEGFQLGDGDHRSGRCAKHQRSTATARSMLYVRRRSRSGQLIGAIEVSHCSPTTKAWRRNWRQPV